MRIKGVLLILLIFAFSRTEATVKEEPGEGVKEIYTAALEMRVQIYRITRDKIYEIYHPGFELIQPDLADAVEILEEKISEVESFPDDIQGKEHLQQAVSVWNNLRFHTMRKLEKKDFVRFYYDTQTFDNFLRIMIEKLEDVYKLQGKEWEELKKRYTLQSVFFKVNIGYLAGKNNISKSMQNVMSENLKIADGLFTYAKQQGYFTNSGITTDLVNVLNDWLFLKYNLNNVFFTADLTVFSTTDSLYERMKIINDRFEK
jgi:hypothetical protein